MDTMHTTTPPVDPAEDTARPLSARLREETARAHEEAEHSVFMEQLLSGGRDRAAFVALQEQAYLFYSALEDAVRTLADDPRVAAVADPGLERAQVLAEDLRVLGGEVDATPSAATRRYIDELVRIRDGWDAPGAVAHHYVRYLGDLSGGQVIARRMGELYGVPAEGLGFYRFDGVDKIKPYRDRYRRILDGLAFTEEESADLVRQATVAFSLNQGVFGDLADATAGPGTTDTSA
ncbi:biliverdin-producing heme oxygenase [Corynebacterium bovis]|uniref:biliverdin-producing heme oxygenase n=1 Tax=Corynebacterium bovis TaxID=36808 RepID=UPI0031394220